MHLLLFELLLLKEENDIRIHARVFLRIPNLKIRIYTNVMNVIRMYLLVFWLVGLMMVNGFPDCRVYGG